MRTLSVIATVMLVSTMGSAAYAQERTAPIRAGEDSGDTGTTGRIEMPAPKRAFEIGINGGYTVPFGEIADDVMIRGVVVSGGAVGLALGYRFDPHWSVEGTGQFQELVKGDSVDRTIVAIRGLTMGVQGTYHFRPYRRVDPYVSLGTGYRMMWVLPAGAPSDMIHGFEVAKAIIGLDFRLTPSLAFGPMAGADLNVFVWENPAGGNGDRRLDGPRPSTFLFVGIGGRFDIGGSQVPREPTAMISLVPRPREAPAPAASVPVTQARPLTFTAVTIEQRILAACKIEGPKAYFDFDEADVKGTDRSTLDQVAVCFTTGPLQGKAIKVVGHADARGTDEHNQKLGQSRAESVSRYLSGKGMPAPEMGTESRGEQDATGTDEIGMAFDRRVDIRMGD